MLIQFTVGNFLSFKEKTTFSMLASPDEPGHEDRVVKINDDISVLRIAAIYGANASGKSNLLKAISFARNLIVNGTFADETISREPFILNKTNRQLPSYFEFIFYINEKIIQYGFEVSHDTIYSEWLKDLSENILIFKREFIRNYNSISYDDRINNIFSAPAGSPHNTITKERFEFIREGTRRNQLFLTEAVNRNAMSLAQIRSWFKSNLIVQADNIPDNIPVIQFTENGISDLAQFLSNCDTGIDDLIFQNSSANNVEIPASLEAIHPDDIIIGFTTNKYGRVYVKFNKNERQILEMQASHNGVYLPWSLESEGTRNITELWQTTILKFNSIVSFFIDEIDQSIHPELFRYFVEYWIKDQYSSQNQLIFTTHNDNLLEDDLLRRDEVWLVTKNKDGASELASLVEYKIQPGTNLQKAYIRGWFNGVPRLGPRNFYHTIRENTTSDAPAS